MVMISVTCSQTSESKPTLVIYPGGVHSNASTGFRLEKKLNNWVGAKMAAITGKSRKYENSKRRVNVYRLLRFFRLRL